jgi:hypothetical protein
MLGWGMVQVVDNLLGHREALSSNPNTTGKKMAAHTPSHLILEGKYFFLFPSFR